jgi:hypothetical protein
MSSNLKIIFSKFFILYKLIFRFFKFSQGGLTCIAKEEDENQTKNEKQRENSVINRRNNNRDKNSKERPSTRNGIKI